MNLVLHCNLIFLLISCSNNHLSEDKRLTQFADKAWEDFNVESYMILPETTEIYFIVEKSTDLEALEAALNKRLEKSELDHYSLIIDWEI